MPAPKIITVTSGKGGVGKTTSSAALAAGLALKGMKTVVIDFDVGLRNLDLVMGCERRVVFDFVNVINNEARLKQALIKDKRVENLWILPTSQTRDKDALTKEGVGRVLDELKAEFDMIVCDSPAGIEKGALMALYYADEAVVVTNPEVSSVRDSDRILGVLSSRSRRAERGEAPVKTHLLLTRYDAARVSKGEMLKLEDVLEILAIPLLGIIPESPSVLRLLFYGFKLLQCAVFIWWCYFFADGSLLPFSGNLLSLGLGMALIVAGQTLNASVFYRLGKLGVFYGDRFGYEIPWCRKLPFSLCKHPQYAGALLSISGFFLFMRFPADDWYLLPLLETAYYTVGAYFER